MKQHLRTFACGSVVALAMVLGACGGRETMASKSAEAYREAQAKGVLPNSGGGHGHDTGKAGDTTAAPGHSAHGTDGATASVGTDHGAHGATDHAAQGAADHAAHGASKERGSPHTAHAAQGENTDHAAMQRGSSAAGHAQHVSPSTATTHADHSTAQTSGGSMQHGATQPGATQSAPLRVDPTSTSREMATVRSGATLRSDDFDVPARISVAEAARAAAGGGHSTSHDAAPEADHSGHASPPDAQSGAMIYSCPMHPEITSTTPGTCPKCGMTLIERKKK